MKIRIILMAIFTIFMLGSCTPRVGVSLQSRNYYGPRPYYKPRPYYNPYYYGRGGGWGRPHHRSYYR